MKQSVLILLLAASAAAALAQTPAKPTTPAKTVTAAKPTTSAKPASSVAGIKLPPGVPPGRGIVKTAFSLRYQDIKVGTGADAEPGKLYKVHYTGWRAADGAKFDSSYDHRAPVMDKDGKPEKDADGKPKLGEAQPFQFLQGGMGGRGPIPGFDQGFWGMKVGGKRRLFIPYQLAYGVHAIPDRGPDHPGIPAKSDLIFDVELLDVTEMQMPQGHPGMVPGQPGKMMNMPPNHPPVTPGTPVAPGTPTTPAPSSTTNSPTAPGTPATPPPTATPATPVTPPPPTADKPQSN